MSDMERERRRRRVEEMKGAFERRAIAAGLEVRASDGALTYSGYGATFSRYCTGANDEVIAPTAFDRTLSESPDCVFTVDHGLSLSGLPLARTRSRKGGPGTLELSVDDHGLFFRAILDAEDPDAQALARAIRNETIRQCSFAFRVNSDVWSEDGQLRTLKVVSLNGGDVSAVTWPANPDTSISARSAAAPRIVIPDYTTRAKERLAALRAGAAGGSADARPASPRRKQVPDYTSDARRRLEELRRRP